MTDTAGIGTRGPIRSVETIYGNFVVPDGDDIIANALHEYGEWAQTEINLLLEFICEGDVVVDGGACFGTHSRAFSIKAGVTGKVFSFEPSPHNRAILNHNVALGRAGSIEVLPYAIGAAAAWVDISNDHANNSGGTKVRLTDVNTSVKMVSLDDQVKTAVNFIKLDLEGFELPALIGADRIIKSYQPVIFAELLDLASGSPVFTHMRDHGYRAYGVNTPAYRVDNFKKSKTDIFRGGTECGILFIYDADIERHASALEKTKLPELKTLDDVGLLLLQQPQYRSERLAQQNSARYLSLPVEQAVHDAALRAQSEAIREIENLRRAVDTKARDLKRARSEAENYTERIQAKLAEIEPILLQWRIDNGYILRLLKRVRAFPFALYFKLKSRHRRSTRRLLRSPDNPERALNILNELRAVLHSSGTGPETSSPLHHTSTPNIGDGYRRKVAQAISIIPKTAVLAPFPEDLPSVVNAEDIFGHLQACRDHVVVSISQDDYRVMTGGTQMCVQIEAAGAAASKLDYLNIHPVRTSNALLELSEMNSAMFRIILNGECIGMGRYDEITAALKRRRHSSQNFHFVIHHLLGHAPEPIEKMVKDCGDGKAYFWLHDFFAACRSYTLLRNNLAYCGGPDVKSLQCRICAYGDSRALHVERFQKFFASLDIKAISPSHIAAEVWTKACDYPLADLVVQPHAVLNVTGRNMALDALAEGHLAPIRIAFVGSANHLKGWEPFIDLVNDNVNSIDLEFHYFGKSDVPKFVIKHHVDGLTAKSKATMVNALTAAGIDLVIHMAPWPETFSLTTVESLASYAYVVTQSSSGNVAELVRATGRGKVLSDASELNHWVRSEEFRRLVQQGRELRQSELLKLTYSDMTINKILADVSR